MSEQRLLKVLLAPIVTEKTARLAENESRQFAFRVVKNATKEEIRGAVEQLFNVEVGEVRVANVKGKRKGFRGRQGRRSDWKKAYVTLRPGFDINFAEAE
ncbi:MAG: 50S ribosomal protein L23 [Gammaproteobacteria bacterium]|nr:MAG: 50S ribosomal protein L23 [Gammaproteobacteria bacterium]